MEIANLGVDRVEDRQPRAPITVLNTLTSFTIYGAFHNTHLGSSCIEPHVYFLMEVLLWVCNPCFGDEGDEDEVIVKENSIVSGYLQR